MKSKSKFSSQSSSRILFTVLIVFLNAWFFFNIISVWNSAASDLQSKNPEQQIQNIFQSGVTSFQQNDFDKAAENFLQALSLDKNNPSVLYNLGLAEFKKNKQPGQALAYWQRAIEVAPWYSPPRRALEWVQTQWGPRFAQRSLSSYEIWHKEIWLRVSPWIFKIGTAICFYFLGIQLIQIWVFRRKKSLALHSAATSIPVGPTNGNISSKPQSVKSPRIDTIIAALFMFFLNAMLIQDRDLSIARGSITMPEVPVHTAPHEASPTLWKLDEGSLVHLLRSDGKWLQVEDIQNRVGWVSKNSVFRIDQSDQGGR